MSVVAVSRHHLESNPSECVCREFVRSLAHVFVAYWQVANTAVFNNQAPVTAAATMPSQQNELASPPSQLPARFKEENALLTVSGDLTQAGWTNQSQGVQDEPQAASANSDASQDSEQQSMVSVGELLERIVPRCTIPTTNTQTHSLHKLT